ncbi:MAG: hypothetical protein WKI04_06665, partial [Ferruginibacter sp.]
FLCAKSISVAGSGTNVEIKFLRFILFSFEAGQCSPLKAGIAFEALTGDPSHYFYWYINVTGRTQ